MKNTRFATYLTVLFLIFFQINNFAQKFSATVDKTTVGLNEYFQVDFVFEEGNVNELQAFTPPSFNGLIVISGPNESRSMRIINGQVSGSLTYSFVLKPRKLGKVQIGSAQITYRGKVLKTNPITVNVVKETAGRKIPSSTGISQEELKKNVFILAIPDKRRAMQGEQITVTYKLYTRLNIASPQISKLPKYKGFWAEELESSQTINFKYEMYSGKRYKAAVIKKVALFPTKSGELTVTPFELKIPVIVKKKRSVDIFDDFFNDSFFGRTKTIDFFAKSNTIRVKVAPLPGNKPESFGGAVGVFDISASVDKKKVKVNESITLRVKVSGRGNIALLEIPEVKLPPGMEKYEPKITQSIRRKNIVSGRKVAEYLIVPRIPGEKTIPPIEFTYFDLRKKKFETIKTPEFKITVEKGENDYTPLASGYSKEDVKLLSKDIRFIKTTFSLRKKSDFKLLSNWFWFAAIFPLILLAGVISYNKYQNKISGDVSLLRFQKAEKRAKQKLKEAHEALQNGNKPAYYEGLYHALLGYLEDKLNISKAEFTKEKALNKLKQLGIPENVINEIKDIFEKCELARFAPNAQTRESEEKLYNKTLEIINELQNSISNRKKAK